MIAVEVDDPSVPVKGVKRRGGQKRRQAHKPGMVAHSTVAGAGVVGRLREQDARERRGRPR